MKSGLRDRNNDEAGYGTRYMNASLSQWSPVLETGTIHPVVGTDDSLIDVSMKSGLRDRNNTWTEHDPHLLPKSVSMKSGLRDRNNYAPWPWALGPYPGLNEVRS